MADEAEEVRRRTLAAKQAPIEDGLFARVLIAEAEAPTHKVPVRAHLRTVPGNAPPSGEERAASVLDRMAGEEPVKWAVRYVRAKLSDLYRERAYAFRMGAQSSEPFVTADDADRLLREWALFPVELRERGNQNWRGTIFRGGGWYRTGRSITAKRKHMNATDLPCWALREQVAA